MTMHPELEHAFDTGASMQEVIDIFAKYHHGPKEEEIDYQVWADTRHNNSIFWDNWHPLFRSLDIYDVGRRFIDIIEPSFNIHKALTRDVISWLCDAKRESNIYLISESCIPGRGDEFGGYSRTVAMSKICSDSHRFGNSIYVQTVCDGFGIERLSVQLAAAYPPYRHILSQILIDYPGIRRLPQRVLFKKLIHDPWKAVQHCHPGYITAPPVVILEYRKPWLDNVSCIILELGLPLHSSPLLWIISVDPKYKLPIQDLSEPFIPRYIRPPVCYNEALGDAASILRHKFSDLHRQFNYPLDDDNEVWPSNEQITQLARVVLGVFEFIDVIIKFVDREEDGGPQAHLETFLGYMVDSPQPSDEQRYCALDHFYIRALSSIPLDVFPGVKKAFSIVRWIRGGFDAIELPLLVLRRVDTAVPYISWRLASQRGYHNIYSSRRHFRRFIEDHNRSGQFFTPKSESCLQAYQAWLQFISCLPDIRIILKALVSQLSQDDLTESLVRIPYTNSRAASMLCDMRMMRAANKVLLRQFNFRCLAYNCDNIGIKEFVSLINVLYEAEGDNSSGIVHVEPISPLDREFIDKCQGLAC